MQHQPAAMQGGVGKSEYKIVKAARFALPVTGNASHPISQGWENKFDEQIAPNDALNDLLDFFLNCTHQGKP